MGLVNQKRVKHLTTNRADSIYSWKIWFWSKGLMETSPKDENLTLTIGFSEEWIKLAQHAKSYG